MRNLNKTLPLDFEALLAPLSVSEFLTSHWLETYCHIPGCASKFADLMPWADLNRILEHHSLEYPRLRLIKDGKIIDSGAYTQHRTRDGKIESRIVAKDLTDQLRDGATMTFDHANRVHGQLNLLAEGLERWFSSKVSINVYAAFRTAQGANVHWDDHEVFVLQVSGKKRWLLYGKDRKVDDPKTLPPNPLANLVLAEGDLLYIPRGLWHAAVPLDEPCLHLTAGVSIPSAPEILRWVSSELESGDVGQVCTSSLESESHRIEFIDKLKEAVVSKLDLSLLDRYFESSNLTRTAGQHVSLPWAATPQGLPPEDHDVLVRLSGRRAASLRVDSERRNVELTSGAKSWRFPIMMRPILEALIDGRFVPLAQLVAIGQETVGEQIARAFMGTLVKGGVVFLIGSDGR